MVLSKKFPCFSTSATFSSTQALKTGRKEKVFKKPRVSPFQPRSLNEARWRRIHQNGKGDIAYLMEHTLCLSSKRVKRAWGARNSTADAKWPGKPSEFAGLHQSSILQPGVDAKGRENHKIHKPSLEQVLGNKRDEMEIETTAMVAFLC